MLLGEILNKKYISDETGIKLALFLKKVASDTNLLNTFKAIYDNKLSEEARGRITLALQYSA